jgi:chromate reductase
MGASTGPFGTVRGQTNLRQILACLNVMVLPQPQVLVPFAETAFNADGSLVDEKTTAILKRLLKTTLNP